MTEQMTSTISQDVYTVSPDFPVSTHNSIMSFKGGFKWIMQKFAQQILQSTYNVPGTQARRGHCPASKKLVAQCRTQTKNRPLIATRVVTAGCYSATE